MFQPTGQAVLARLGLLDAVLTRATPVERLVCQTARGRELFRLRYAALQGNLRGYGLHRGVLFEALYDAVNQSNVKLHTGVEVVDLAEAPNGMLSFVTRDRTPLGPHALCVVADGARSQLRDDTGIRKRVEPYPWGALWFVGDDDVLGTSRELHQVVDGTRRMIGTLPTGLGPGTHTTPQKVSLFYSIRHDRVDEWRARGLGAARDEILTAKPSAERLLAQIVDIDQFIFTRYHDVSMYPWNTNRVVYLGDAAHAMSPQLGQGANLALWDAMVLADALAAETSVASALTRYSRTRRAHLGFYEYATRWITPWFQSDLKPLGWLRDVCMPISRIPWIERVMVRAMTGTAQGLGLWSPLALDAPMPRLDG
jgi:2-polyprenyl-6-methoxyphenol hydroxylase-like FAD-dependent oxidoreductase